MNELTWQDYTDAVPFGDPNWASSIRGWAYEPGYTPGKAPSCANYLDYTGSIDVRKHPDRTIHVVAYRYKFNPHTQTHYGCQHFGATWCATVAEAKAWVEQTLAAHPPGGN